jgi:hypothetical protein
MVATLDYPSVRGSAREGAAVACLLCGCVVAILGNAFATWEVYGTLHSLRPGMPFHADALSDLISAIAIGTALVASPLALIGLLLKPKRRSMLAIAIVTLILAATPLPLALSVLDHFVQTLNLVGG